MSRRRETPFDFIWELPREVLDYIMRLVTRQRRLSHDLDPFLNMYNYVLGHWKGTERMRLSNRAVANGVLARRVYTWAKPY